ncbi:MAG: hypothetical protein R2844_15375 [Caldilineales bacterium]
MSANLRMQLSYASATAVEVRVEESARGEPRQVVEMPLQGAAIKTLLGVLEATDAGNQPLTESQAATLHRAGILDAGRPPAADELRRRIGRLLFNALFPTSNEPDRDVRCVFRNAGAGRPASRAGGAAAALRSRCRRFGESAWELLAYDDEPLVASGRVRSSPATSPLPRLPRPTR